MCKSRTMRSAAARSVTQFAPGSIKRGSNLRTDLLEGGAGVGDDRTQSIKQMDHTRVASIGQRRSAVGQAREIMPPLVAQRIDLRRVNDGLGRPLSPRTATARCADLAGRRPGRIMHEIVIERVLIDQIAERSRGANRCGGVIQDGTDQQLKRRARRRGAREGVAGAAASVPPAESPHTPSLAASTPNSAA